MARREAPAEGPPVGERPVARKRPAQKVAERVTRFKDEYSPREGVLPVNCGFFLMQRRCTMAQAKVSGKPRAKLRGARE